MRMRLLVATILAIGCLWLPSRSQAEPRRAAAAAAPVSTWGYIPTSDGVRLRYTLLRPSASGRFPVALNYGPYMSGSDPVGETLQTPRLVGAGYAVLGVNARGSGCSTGPFDPFDRREALDGVEAVEWAAAQRWSTSHIGMFGLSAPAMLQYGPAGLGAHHLDAIAPFQPATDLYRDAVYPGGILDAGFLAAWGAVLQPESSDHAGATALTQGDTECAAALAAHQSDPTKVTLTSDILTHQFDDDAYRSKDPGQYVLAIHVPVLGCVAWQDNDVGSRSLYSFEVLDPATSWLIGTNGYHGVCDATNVWPYLLRFLDRFVKGAKNGFEHTPHVTLFHDAYGTPVDNVALAAYTSAPSTAAWTTTHRTWPIKVRPTMLHLAPKAQLAPVAHAGEAAPDTYGTPLISPGNEDGFFTETHLAWKTPDLAGASLTYTTPALVRDAEFFGSGSANLWLASTATDTDVQITLSEVRPDGQEVYVQRGWLRASHRTLDRVRTTSLRPYETHLALDQRPLVLGQPTPIRVELYPFDYVFRAGSHIRLTIDTPVTSGAWAFATNAVPAANTILHDAAHDSQLVLGLVPHGRAQAPSQPCDTLLNQPCRPNAAPVPTGTINLG